MLLDDLIKHKIEQEMVELIEDNNKILLQIQETVTQNNSNFQRKNTLKN